MRLIGLFANNQNYFDKIMKCDKMFILCHFLKPVTVTLSMKETVAFNVDNFFSIQLVEITNFKLHIKFL